MTAPETSFAPIRRALISVSDKTGVAEFARVLSERHGVEILSTGGTAKAMREAGVPVVDVAEHTGAPEIMDGRVKTLHPKIHGGILGRRGTDDAVMDEHAIAPIDLVVVNLYPFEQTVAAPDCDRDTAIETIDIGGPAMLRAAAKNHAYVTLVVDAGDYDAIILASSGLKRLGFSDRIRYCLPDTFCLPAVGQGALGIECRLSDNELRELLDPLNHADSADRVKAERAMNRRLEGGCQVPIAAYALLEEDDTVWLRGLVGSVDGTKILRVEGRAPRAEGERLGRELAEQLLGMGADKVLAEVYGHTPT